MTLLESSGASTVNASIAQSYFSKYPSLHIFKLNQEGIIEWKNTVFVPVRSIYFLKNSTISYGDQLFFGFQDFRSNYINGKRNVTSTDFSAKDFKTLIFTLAKVDFNNGNIDYYMIDNDDPKLTAWQAFSIWSEESINVNFVFTNKKSGQAKIITCK
jgi:hypothetical protein